MSTVGSNWLMILVIVLWAVAQYGFAIWALRDLARRPRVRGEKKVAWALLILIVPVLGPVLYSSLGPTSFLPRRTTPAPRLPRARQANGRPLATRDVSDPPRS